MLEQIFPLKYFAPFPCSCTLPVKNVSLPPSWWLRTQLACFCRGCDGGGIAAQALSSCPAKPIALCKWKGPTHPSLHHCCHLMPLRLEFCPRDMFSLSMTWITCGTRKHSHLVLHISLWTWQQPNRLTVLIINNGEHFSGAFWLWPCRADLESLQYPALPRSTCLSFFIGLSCVGRI